jgi:hypothetical protein
MNPCKKCILVSKTKTENIELDVYALCKKCRDKNEAETISIYEVPVRYVIMHGTFTV